MLVLGVEAELPTCTLEEDASMATIVHGCKE
jgi:hypothetical protein